MGNKWYLFLARISFICNILFIFSLLLRYTHVQLPEAVSGIVLILGWLPVLPLVNLLTAVVLILLLIRKQPVKPAWLSVVNTLFFCTQLFYFIAIYR